MAGGGHDGRGRSRPAGTTAAPTVVFGDGASRHVAALLEARGVRSLFLVTGGGSFERSGARAALAPALAGRRIVRWAGVRSNPTLEEVEPALDAFRQRPCDAVLAAGGGSVLDVAKVVAALADEPGPAADYLAGDRRLTGPRRPGLVLVPTTAGSGSEATRFATVYVAGRKRSLDHLALRCDAALVDPLLTWSQPRPVAAAAGLDALCHAVESYWSPRSTVRSRTLACRALRLLWTRLPAACAGRTPAARRSGALAAHLAGRAIDETRTTGAHALAYPLTAHFRVPHGHACALNMSWLLPFNCAVTRDDAADPRGAGFVRARLAEVLAVLGLPDAAAARPALLRLVARLGLSTGLRELGVVGDDVPLLVAEGLASERAAGNPRRLTPAAAAAGLEGLL
jgi:alcohol dehydrogenase class IV